VRWVTGQLRRLHNIELHSLYSSPDIIGVIKSKTMRWLVHMAHVEIGFWWGNLRRRDHLEALATDGSITLKWIF
jgi:hypothetical protein